VNLRKEKEKMIAAGIVTYNPDIEVLKRNYSKYIDEIEILYVYDNASNNIEQIEELFEDINKVKLIKGNDNKGIAYALNHIMKTAKNDGINWVFTMDQDSECQDKIVTSLKPYCRDDIGIIHPYVIEKGGTRTDYLYKNKVEYVDLCITSASLTSVNIWEQVGGFDEWMFIDIVDFEFCSKVREAGYKILQINDVFLFQEVGQLKEVVIGKRHIYVRNHPPFRKYYFARNLIYCSYCHPKSFYHRKVLDMLITMYIKIILFERQKIKKIKAMNRGIQDAKIKIRELKKVRKQS